MAKSGLARYVRKQCQESEPMTQSPGSTYIGGRREGALGYIKALIQVVREHDNLTFGWTRLGLLWENLLLKYHRAIDLDGGRDG